ncbi:MAG: aspartyl protease family protein [Lacipirellulaceae bacterium]
MGRIVTQVSVGNFAFPDQHLECSAMVDTGASHLTLPLAWKERLGEFPIHRSETLYMANQTTVAGQVCGPVRIEIEGFEPIASEVLFIEMDSVNGGYEPLLGYIPLEQSKAAIDMQGHRLVAAKHLDLK